MVLPTAILKASRSAESHYRVAFMPRYSLETIIIILVILWLMGAFIAPFGGGLIHLLIVVILVVLLVRILDGRRRL
jgi:hypothetical protein